jgi:hypothetical protein
MCPGAILRRRSPGQRMYNAVGGPGVSDGLF